MINKCFQSKYPILLPGMNGASTLKFAIAAHKAGIFPTISGFNYYYPGPKLYYKKEANIDLEKFDRDLKEFNDQTGSKNLMISVQLLDVLRDDFIELSSNQRYSHIEIVDETRLIYATDLKNDQTNRKKLEYYFSSLKSFNIKPIFKALNVKQWTLKSDNSHNLFFGAVIKSSDAGGLVDSNDYRKPLIEEFKYLKNFSPNKVFVPTGGIYSSKKLKEYIDAGAETVGVGTYFICAEESTISYETKQRLIQASSSEVKKFKDTGHRGIMFSEIKKDDDLNHTQSLLKGIENPNSGHIYAGLGVDTIKEIKPLKDLVEELVADLNQE